MTDKELYQQKQQARLDEWKAEIEKLKAKASRASADAQLDINNHIAALEKKVEAGQAKLSELAAAGEESWESIKEGVEAAWSVLSSAVRDATAKFKEEKD
jgi:hypothetical protein